MIRETNPGDAVAFTATGCFCLAGDELLLIKRQVGKQFSHLWALPAGKLEPGEGAQSGMCRELFEETGISIDSSELDQVNDQVVSGPDGTFRFLTFILIMSRRPSIILKSDEICAATWVDSRYIAKRCVVPYFWDGIIDLRDRLANNAIQPRLFPMPPASPVRRWITTH